MAWSARLTPRCRVARAMGIEVEVFWPDRFQTFPLPTYPEITPGAVRGHGLQPNVQVFRARCDPYRHRRPDRLAARRSALGGALCLHHQLPHQLPRICRARAFRRRCRRGYAYMRWFHTVGAADGGDADLARRAGAARLPQHLALVAAASTPSCSTRAARHDASPIDPPDLLNVGRIAVEKNLEAFSIWTCRGRRSSWATGRRRPARRRVSRRGLPRLADRRGAFRLLRRRRCLRLPIAHRHLRPGDPGGDGLGTPVAAYPSPGRATSWAGSHRPWAGGTRI